MSLRFGFREYSPLFVNLLMALALIRYR